MNHGVTCPRCYRVDAHTRDCPHSRPRKRIVIDVSLRWGNRVLYPLAAVSAALAYIADPLGRWWFVWLPAAGYWTWESVKAWRPR